MVIRYPPGYKKPVYTPYMEYPLEEPTPKEEPTGIEYPTEPLTPPEPTPQPFPQPSMDDLTKVSDTLRDIWSGEGVLWADIHSSIPPQIIASFYSYLESDPEAVTTKLLGLGRIPQTETVLGFLGYTSEEIGEFYTEGAPSLPEAELALSQLFLDVREDPKEMLGWLYESQENIDSFLASIQRIGRTEQTENVLQTLFRDVTEADINELLGGIETVAGKFPETPVAITPEGERISIPWWQQAWQSLYLGIRTGIEQTKQSLFTVMLPNMYPYVHEGQSRVTGMSDEEAQKQGLAYTVEQAAISNQAIEPWRAKFRETAVKQEAEFDVWVKAHPELQPKPEYREDVFKNPELLTDMGWWIHTMAETTGMMIPSLVAGTVVTFTTKRPLLGALTTAAAMTPLEMQGLYEDLIQNGAPQERAEELALVVGAAIASVEVGPSLILMKAIYPIFKPFRRGLQSAVVKAVMRNMIAKGVKNFTAIEVSEALEEVLQGVIGDYTVSFWDENRDIIGKIPGTFLTTIVGTLPIALFGGSMSMRRVSPDVVEDTPEQQRKDWIQDKITGDWYKPQKLTESYVEIKDRLIEEGANEGAAEQSTLNELARTVEGDKAIGEAVKKLEEPTPEPKPPTVKEVPVIPKPTEVIGEGGVPVSPEALIPRGVVDAIPMARDIGILEKVVRPSRKVFERFGLFVEHRGVQVAEVKVGEAKKATLKKVNELRKSVGKKKERWGLIADEVNEEGSVTGLEWQEKRVVNWLRQWADEWADIKNLPKSKRIKDYLPHLFEKEMREQLEQTGVLPAELASLLDDKITRKITDPFLKERLGAVGWIRDPFKAVEAYEAAANRVLYYEPLLQKITAVANDPNVLPITREYLKDYSRRMTGEPHSWDVASNNLLVDLAEAVRKWPGGERLYQFATHGNPTGIISYTLTGLYYPLWMGFKATTAIRNLSQHTLIIAEVGPVHFAKGVAMNALPTAEYKSAMDESIGIRSRKLGHPVPGLEESFARRWIERFLKFSLLAFGGADRLNVRSAFCAGYSEAKSMLVEANKALPSDRRITDERLREFLIWRGDEVLADTQYLYTKMNAMALSQSGVGRWASVLTTWAENWTELIVKWVKPRQAQVYRQFEKETGAKLPKKNWSATYKSLIMYMAILALGYALKERERIKAWEYTGITSVRYLADVFGGDLPGLEVPGAVAKLVAGFVSDDERMMKEGWNALTRTLTFSVWKQIDAVASGEKDWLTLLAYLEGRDFYIKKLKNKWEKGWGEYEALETDKDRDQYRKDNPLIEAQMFITSKFTTLTTEAARQLARQIIEENNLDVELINGYEKVFGVDTNEKFNAYRKQLGEVELTEDGEQKLKENGELDYYTTSNFASDVNALEKVVGRYEIEKDGNELAIEYLRAKDLIAQYDGLTEDEARILYRQQFPDVEASMYLWGHKNIKSFKNPKSAEILLGLMDKYNIPPESVPAFLEDPSKYDELFTPYYELKKNTFDLSIEYDNYSNKESTLYIEEDKERAEAREKLKADNPLWVDDMRRIEAYDKEAPVNTIEEYVEYGRIVDDTSPSSPNAKLFKLEHPELFKWGQGDDVFKWDDLVDENIDILRLRVKYEDNFEYYDSLDEDKRDAYLILNREFQDAYYRVQAYTEGYAEEHWDKFAEFSKLPTWGDWRERFLIEQGNREFYKEWLSEDVGQGHRIINSTLVSPTKRDELYREFYASFKDWDDTAGKTDYEIEKMREKLLERIPGFAEARVRVDAYDQGVPELFIDDVVKYRELPTTGYDQERYLKGNDDFYKKVWLGVWGNEKVEFDNVPTKNVEDLYNEYNSLPSSGNDRLKLRCENKSLDEWLVRVKGYTPAYGTDRCSAIGAGGDGDGGVSGGIYGQLEEQGLLEEYTKKFD